MERTKRVNEIKNYFERKLDFLSIFDHNKSGNYSYLRARISHSVFKGSFNKYLTNRNYLHFGNHHIKKST